MTGKKAPSRLDKAIRLAVSALILLPAAFSPEAAAQQTRIERVGVSAPVGGVQTAASIGGMNAGAALVFGGAPSLSLAASPSPLAPSAVPAPALPAGRLTPAASEASSQPSVPTASFAAAGQKSGLRSGAGVSRRTAALESAPLAAAADGPHSAETDRDGAQRDFSALLGERLAEAKPDASAPVAAAAPSVSAARLARPNRAGVRILAGVPAVVALGLHPSLLAILNPSAATWHSISQVGNVVGNVGCAIFPLIQIYETFRGKSTPKFQAIIGAAASLGLGLINAPLLHDRLWGIQNIFGGITLLVPLLIGGLAGRARGNGIKETMLIAAAALAASACVYFAAAATVPALLAAAFSAAAVAKIALCVQVATSAMFVWMFLPDSIKVLRGRSTQGFSQGFTLVFFLSSTASMVWALPSAWIFDDAHKLSYQLIFGVNAIYALTSFVTYWFARRRAKTP